MSRVSYSIMMCAAAALAALAVHAQSAEETSGDIGAMVDAEVPATYRLPLVDQPHAADSDLGPLFGAPEAPNNDQCVETAATAEPDITPVIDSAGSPPDDGSSDAGLADAGGDTTDTGPAVMPVNTPAAAAAVEVAALPIPEITPEIAAAETSEVVVPTVLRHTPTTAELTTQLLPAVQRGFALGQRGALFAAQTEFVQVLRRIAQAHDAAANTGDHSRALAAGWRALDEAEDFVPDGVQLEAEMQVGTIASSHRTEILPAEPQEISPFEAVSLYHSFAEKQLKAAVAGEQAGSMALHGLGTIYSRLAERADDDMHLTRSAVTMYTAAVGTCPNNHLAANELGVLLCRSGRSDAAVALFESAIDHAPSALTYHNLATAQRKMGQHAQAQANEAESLRLATLERTRGDISRRAGVQWVSPDEMARVSVPPTWTPGAVNGSSIPQPPQKSTWQRVVDSTKSLPRPGGFEEHEGLGPQALEAVAQPTRMPNQPRWR